MVLSIRPEDVELSERRPDGENIYEGHVDQKVFLGEFVDFQVRIGGRTVQSRLPTRRLRTRQSTEKCVVLKYRDGIGPGENAVGAQGVGERCGRYE